MISNMPKKLGYTIAYWFQLQPKGRQGINSLSNSESGGGRVYLTCLQALRLLANPPLQLIANGARSQFQLRSCTNVNKGICRGGGRVYLTCLQALRLLANPPLQLIANGARSQFQPTFAISQGFEPLAVVGDTTLLLVAIL
jgi:hypothetical protein